MKSKILRMTPDTKSVLALTALAVAASGIAWAPAALAGSSKLPEHFSGLLNDYTPRSSTAGTPYEMHGSWSLHLREDRGTATFSAEMTMETADFANSDPSFNPTNLGAHTHHISVTDGVIHNDPTDPINWKTACPTFKIPVAGGFVVTGTAYVVGNGGNPPFGNPSALTICILGGMQNPSIAGTQALVEFSNFTLKFGATSPASTHFGSQPINGVVTGCERPWTHESEDCKVELVE